MSELEEAGAAAGAAGALVPAAGAAEGVEAAAVEVEGPESVLLSFAELPGLALP